MIGFKKQFCLLIAFLIGSTIFLSCDKQNDKLKVDKKNTDTVIAKSIEEKNQSFSELKVKDTEKFNKYYIIGRINENEFIVGSTIDNTTIGIYDDKADSFKVIQRPKIKDNHFFDVVYDNGWLVWSENKDAAIGPEDAKGFNWLVVAKNITSGEERIIDKAKYTEKQFNVPQTYYYCPIYLSINNGYVVYRASDKRDSDGKLINKVMLYSLASDKLSTLSTSDEMDKEAYLLTSTDGKKVMWLHLKERNKAGRFSIIIMI